MKKAERMVFRSRGWASRSSLFPPGRTRSTIRPQRRLKTMWLKMDPMTNSRRPTANLRLRATVLLILLLTRDGSRREGSWRCISPRRTAKLPNSWRLRRRNQNRISRTRPRKKILRGSRNRRPKRRRTLGSTRRRSTSRMLRKGILSHGTGPEISRSILLSSSCERIPRASK